VRRQQTCSVRQKSGNFFEKLLAHHFGWDNVWPVLSGKDGTVKKVERKF
jgi:hypothetical protein